MAAPTSDETLLATLAAIEAEGSMRAAARALGIDHTTVIKHKMRAAERGLTGYDPVMPGFAVKSVASKVGDAWIKQTKEHGDEFEMPDGHVAKGVSALVDAEGRVIQKWIKTREDEAIKVAARQAAIEALREDIKPAPIVAAPASTMANLLCQYTITDAHLGALAWNEETGGGDYDLSIGEKLILNWFAAAIAASPPARRAVFAQLGDFLHYDSFKSITPEHGHILDGDTRYPKMVRAAIRIVRTAIRLLLEKHETVDVIMSDANHDPTGGVWLREMFAVFLADEPRAKVDTNPGTYSLIEHDDVSLFYHHGHRRNPKNVDSVLVGKYREAYGRTKYSYAHTGHKHADELVSTNLMKVEQHETLAAPDAYAANGGWLSGRSAKVIHYDGRFGEVGRSTITAAMVA